MVRNKIIQAAILLLSLSLLLFAAGCDNDRQQEAVGQMIEYMELRYGGDYMLQENLSRVTHGLRSCLLETDNFPWPVYVQVEDAEGESPEFGDNYVAVMYRDQTANYIADCAADVWGDAKVAYEPNLAPVPAEITPSVSFQEFLSMNTEPLHFKVLVKEADLRADDADDRIVDFGQTLAVSGMTYTGKVAGVLNTVYSATSLDELDGLFRDRRYRSCVSVLNYNGRLEYDWLASGG